MLLNVSSDCGSGTSPLQLKYLNSSRLPFRTFSIKRWIRMTDEILKWIFLSKFLSHKEHGHMWRQEISRQRPVSISQTTTFRVSRSPRQSISDLIMVLCKNNELSIMRMLWHQPKILLAMRRVLASIHIRVFQRFHQVAGRPEIFIVSVHLFRYHAHGGHGEIHRSIVHPCHNHQSPTDRHTVDYSGLILRSTLSFGVRALRDA